MSSTTIVPASPTPERIARRFAPLLATVALVALVALIAVHADLAEMLKSAVGEGRIAEGGDFNAFIKVGNKLSKTALPITIGLAAPVAAGCLVALQLGGRRQAIPILFGSVAAVLGTIAVRGVMA